MKTLKVFGIFACALAFVLMSCAKNSATNPSQQSGAVFDYSDTLALRAMLDSNGISTISAGSASIVTLALDSVTNFHRIVELKLSNKGLRVIPAQIKALTALEILRMDTNSIAVLPGEIGKCTSLVYIQMSYNQLASLPSEIGSLHSLRTLLLSHNALSSLPQSLWTITALQQLDLDYNQLDSLSPLASNLVNLSRLTLNNNKLTTLPASLRLDTLLGYIQIDSNSICPAAINALDPTFVGWLTNRAELNWDSTQTCP